MSVRIRLSGDPDEIATVIAVLRHQFEVAGGEHPYPNRGALGVRVYLETRTRRNPQPESPSHREHPTR